MQTTDPSGFDQGAQPYDKTLRLNRVCAVCNKPLQPVRLGQQSEEELANSNQMDGAMDIEIRGYYGTTVFDGTDWTGQVMLGYICDECGRPMVQRMNRVHKYEDRTIKPGSPEALELLEALRQDGRIK